MSIDLAPLVLPIDQPTNVTIAGLTPGAEYAAHVRARRQDAGVTEHALHADGEGRARLSGTYDVRGEHYVDLCPVPATDRLVRLSFYIAPPELLARRPLRGDFHIHTLHSDGRNTPAEMIVRARELGLDVAVITDHNAYQGSAEAMQAQRDLALNVITMPGEEVSGPNWHIVSLNAGAPIYPLLEAAYGVESDEDRERLWVTAAPGDNALNRAIEATHQHGGHAFLAHPYWTVERGFHLPSDVYDRALDEGLIDGIELLGDVDLEDNLRSLARYLDYRAAGHDIPIIGNSDTHGARHVYGVYWTLIWAEDPTPEGVLQAIADGWSVACTTVVPVHPAQRREAMHAYGTFELVDYCLFLEEQFYPLHDRLCVEEASLAYRAWRGEPITEGAMAEQHARMEALYARCWRSGE